MDINASVVKVPNTINCEICELFGIHKNDYENHVKSRGHRKKLREKQRRTDESTEEEFQCECCNRKFKGGEYYKAHLGSKTHRRNMRNINFLKGESKLASEDLPVSRSSRRFRRLSLGDHEDTMDTKFFRKKYKTRVVKIEDLNYKTYIYSLTSYLSLRLALDHSIEDFSISVNDREWQAFGDVVVRTFSKGKYITYAIQCKKVTQTPKQIDQLEQSKLHIDKQYNCIAQLRDAGKDVKDTKFIICTTWSTSKDFSQSIILKPTILNRWNTTGEAICMDATLKVKSLSKKNDVIDITNDPENIYSFTLTDNLNCHLPDVFLFTNQRIFPRMLNQLLKSKFEKYPDISSDYSNYIEKWIDGKLGGNYKLKKKDIVLKVGEILLTPYIISPKKVYSKHENDNYAIWNQVINSVDLTVVKNEPFTISKICRPFNMIIEETLCTTIDIISKSITLKENFLNTVGEPFKSYFFEVAQDRISLNDDIPLHFVYNIFWKASRIPLLMSSEGQEEVKGFIMDVILFMKQMGVHKKFLIKSADLNLSRFKENLKIFTCIEDVKSSINWEEVTIRVSESYQLPLNVIQNTDPFFFKWVTPNMFFDISVGKYTLRPNYSSKKNYNKKDILKIILNEETKNTLEYQLYPEFSEISSEYHNENKLRGIEPGIL